MSLLPTLSPTLLASVAAIATTLITLLISWLMKPYFSTLGRSTSTKSSSDNVQEVDWHNNNNNDDNNNRRKSTRRSRNPLTPKPTITLVIPAYNESSRILPMLLSTFEYTSNDLSNVYEYLLVNDGSTDNTIEVVSEFYRGLGVGGEERGLFRIVDCLVNGGKGKVRGKNQ